MYFLHSKRHDRRAEDVHLPTSYRNAKPRRPRPSRAHTPLGPYPKGGPAKGCKQLPKSPRAKSHLHTTTKQYNYYQYSAVLFTNFRRTAKTWLPLSKFPFGIVRGIDK